MKKHSLSLSIFMGIITLWGINGLPEQYHYYYWIAGAVWASSYVYALLKIDLQTVKSKGILFGIVLLHLSAILSGPILEDDNYRYSWDGRNIRMGIHPYSQSPYEQVSGKKENAKDLGFEELTVEDELKQFPEYTQKINYPMYRTVYPPLCEFLFTSESLIPDTHWGWPLFILLVDLAFIYFLVYKSTLPFIASCLVLLNPLFIKEGLNSLHFDFFLIPLMAVFFFSNRKGHPLILGLMAGIRPWYLALIIWQWKKWGIKDYLIFALTLGIPWLTLFLYPGFPEEGFSSWKAFIKTWEFNAVFYEVMRQVFSIFTDSESYFRIASWIAGFSIIAYAWKKHSENSEAGLAAIAGWLLFLPTVNPWYIMPVAVVLVTSHNIRLKAFGCALCVSLPLAYIHYEHIIPGSLTALSWSLFEVSVAFVTFFLVLHNFKNSQSTNILNNE